MRMARGAEMRLVRQLVLGLLALVLVVVALANRGGVEVRVLPDQIAILAGWNFAAVVPVFVVFFAGCVAGVVIGFVWEWLREHKHRVAARTPAAPTAAAAPAGERDDILALLDRPGRG
jgi:putative membrane protein